MELITITISKEQFDKLVNEGLSDYEVKEVFIKDELFTNDEVHKALLKSVIDSRKKLKEYEFKKRHNIR